MAEYDLPARENPALKSGDVDVQAGPVTTPASFFPPPAAPAPEPEVEQLEEETEQEFPVSDIPTRTNEITDADIERVAREVISGNWGSGEDRRSRLIESDYDYDAVQARVNEILDPSSASYRNYSVQKGDTLKGIANRLDYKGGYQALHEKNRGVIGNNPNALRPGQILSL